MFHTEFAPASCQNSLLAAEGAAVSVIRWWTSVVSCCL